MTTSVEIPDDLLKKAMRAAGTDSPQEAVLKAIKEYSRRRSQADLIRHLGTFEDFMTPEELERMREQD